MDLENFRTYRNHILEHTTKDNSRRANELLGQMCNSISNSEYWDEEAARDHLEIKWCKDNPTASTLEYWQDKEAASELRSSGCLAMATKARERLEAITFNQQ